MKLICPNCKTEILNSSINITEAIAQCNACNEVFKIADYLNKDEEVERIPKPTFTKVNIEDNFDSHTITIPTIGWNSNSIYSLIFACFWNSISFANFFEAYQKNKIDIMTFIFLIIGVFTFLFFLFTLLAKIEADFNRDIISVSRIFLGLNYKKKKSSKWLESITEEIAYRTGSRQERAVYAISLNFCDNSTIRFGTKLNEEERKWLIGELYEMKKKYQTSKDKF